VSLFAFCSLTVHSLIRTM